MLFIHWPPRRKSRLPPPPLPLLRPPHVVGATPAAVHHRNPQRGPHAPGDPRHAPAVRPWRPRTGATVEAHGDRSGQTAREWRSVSTPRYKLRWILTSSTDEQRKMWSKKRYTYASWHLQSALKTLTKTMATITCLHVPSSFFARGDKHSCSSGYKPDPPALAFPKDADSLLQPPLPPPLTLRAQARQDRTTQRSARRFDLRRRLHGRAARAAQVEEVRGPSWELRGCGADPGRSELVTRGGYSCTPDRTTSQQPAATETWIFQRRAGHFCLFIH